MMPPGGELRAAFFGSKDTPPLASPPLPEELEVSLFGAGIGESVVVHVGDGEWMVVDSCLDTRSRLPVATKYLRTLGLDPARVIKAVVVSHWHDDHIEGIASIFAEATDSTCHCSIALREREFQEMIAASRRARTTRYAAAELSRIVDIAQARLPPGSRPATVGIQLVMESKVLFRTDHAQVFALSPSAGSVALALQEIAQALPRYGREERRLVVQTPNQIAVALWVAFDGTGVVLGADLERSSNPMAGWQAAIVSAQNLDLRDAIILKVPHHGSVDADGPAVWESLLGPEPCAVVSPFTRSGLPRPSDIRRLKGRTPHVFCTAPSVGGRPPRRSNAVDKMANTAARHRHLLEGAMGHVRVRVRPDRSMLVQMSHPAFHA